MRLQGDISSQGKMVAALARIFSRKEGVALAEQPSKGHVGTKIANDVLKSIGVGLGADSILVVCNQLGMSQRAYGEIYKTVKGRIGLVNKDIKATILSKPHHVILL